MVTPIKIKQLKNCLTCSDEFLAKRCIARFCSKLCMVKHQNKRRRSIKNKWAKDHSEYHVQYNTLRRRHLQKAKVAWANEEKLNEIYKQAKQTGMTVDHIIPLKHPLVCGLHVPENLQLLTKVENTRKHNKFNILVGYTE